MGELDHMNAHLHSDGSIGYWYPCDAYCRGEAAQKRKDANPPHPTEERS